MLSGRGEILRFTQNDGWRFSMTENAGCELRYPVENIGGWDVTIAEFEGSEAPISVLVWGIIGNSVPTSPTGKKIRRDWRHNVMSEVKAARGGSPWDSSLRYAVSLGMTFNPKNHYYQKLDVENFIKPTLDAVAAGLFCDEDTEPHDIGLWNFDDSGFRTLLIHRFEDTPNPKSEGVAIHVSAI